MTSTGKLFTLGAMVGALVGVACGALDDTARASEGEFTQKTCAQWTVLHVRPDPNVMEYDLQAGYEPFHAEADGDGLFEITSRKCLEWVDID